MLIEAQLLLFQHINLKKRTSSSQARNLKKRKSQDLIAGRLKVYRFVEKKKLREDP